MLLSRGALRKQLSSVLAGIKAQGLKIEDVVAEEMLDHLPGLAELKEGRTYIADLETREQTLLAQNDDLLNKLKAKEVEIQDQPGNIKSLEIELQQAQRHIEIYKGISEDADKRADRLQKKLDSVQSKETISDSLSAKVETLQTQLHTQLSSYQLLLQKHNQATEAADQQRTQYQHAFNTQHTRLQAIITAKTEALSTAHAETARIEAETQAISDAYTSLIDTLEIDHANVSAAVNQKALELRKSQITVASLNAQLEPLVHFATHTAHIIKIYQTFAHALFNPTPASTPVRLGRDFTALLDRMADALDLYEELAEQPVEAKAPHALIREAMDTLAVQNGLVWDMLGGIYGDVEQYIAKCRPKEQVVAGQVKGNFVARLRKRLVMS
ncbi:hypothetical protein IAQ61_005019 [Plenodomus lingam]|uniref:Uncharacterized protein n=1 Tax=Leptosphaeria maculans (strain JN3 / isolate v23.1.3 / race Av1-4-5-6-7-8) TaxID=985895 RepID=M1ZIS9_LEPMJ|nr:hypothetical protein IAQ61_005019 [Plenodomus lingam]CCT61162.1 hypothetical protein [Plenodomus lingam JN3]